MRGAWVEISCGSRSRSRQARRSPCGERGLKWPFPASESPGVGRSPCGERGLKSRCCPMRHTSHRSLPVRGAWVEIHTLNVTILLRLKSLPVRGAWVEIQRSGHLPAAKWSLPVRGAWVEMRSTQRSGCRRTSRSPCGERGLKFFCPAPFCGHPRRSPCGERGLK